MLNPLDVEQRYQNLLFALSLPGTSFQRLRSLEAFLSTLAGEEVQFESYILDCIERVPPLMRNVFPSGHSSDEVLRVYERIREVMRCVPAAAGVTGIQDAITVLRQMLCGQLAYATAWGELGHLLGVPLDAEHFSAGSRLASLENLARTSDNNEAREVLQKLCHEWERRVRAQPGRASVPVVERSLGDERIDSGSLRELTLKIYGESEGGRDAIHEDIAVYGADQKETGLTHVPLQVAHTLLKKIDPRLANKNFSGSITFGNSHELHEGDSAQLVTSTLFVCEILRYANRRRQYRLQPDAALTGALDGEGNVVAVDPDSLPVKVAAAFFSHIETLVVPNQQVGDAELALRRLQEKYPGRSMHIVGVRHALEVFYDRRVVAEVRSTFITHSVRGIVRRRVPLAATLAFLGLLFVVVRLTYGPIDSRPADVVFVGNVMSIRNQHGEIVKESPVDAQTAAHQSDRRRSAMHLLPFGLINDDGQDSVAVVFSGCSQAAQVSPDEIRKWSLVREVYDWIWHPFPDVDFPLKNYEAQGSTHFVSYLALADVDSLPGRDVLVVSHHPTSFPGMLTALSRDTGKPFAEYLHVGFINDIRLFDIDADGFEDILLCGINNAYRMAFVAVLDPRLISGCSPTKGEYVCASHPPAAEKYYVLIPRTVVGQMSDFLKNNNADNIVIDEHARQITLHVADGFDEVNSPSEVIYASLNYRFDSTMRLTQIAPGDAYDVLAEKLVKSGALRQPPDAAYFEGQKLLMQYWDGENWSNVPTMNKRYIEARASLRKMHPQADPGISVVMKP